jgi:predicted RNase H-like HicB family nuclease
MNLAVSKAQPLNTLSWHILLESQADGQVVAWVAEWPDCRVVAESREMAIEALKAMLDEKGKTIEVEPLSVVTATSEENPWEPLYGALKDNPEFIAWAEDFWAGKQRRKDDDEILSVEECMRVV